MRTPESLLVPYLADVAKWQASCARLAAAGAERVEAFYPDRDTRGLAFPDPDGHRITPQNTGWSRAG